MKPFIYIRYLYSCIFLCILLSYCTTHKTENQKKRISSDMLEHSIEATDTLTKVYINK